MRPRSPKPRLAWPLRVGEETLPQVEEFQIGAAPAVTQLLCWVCPGGTGAKPIGEALDFLVATFPPSRVALVIDRKSKTADTSKPNKIFLCRLATAWFVHQQCCYRSAPKQSLSFRSSASEEQCFPAINGQATRGLSLCLCIVLGGGANVRFLSFHWVRQTIATKYLAVFCFWNVVHWFLNKCWSQCEDVRVGVCPSTELIEFAYVRNSDPWIYNTSRPAEEPRTGNGLSLFSNVNSFRFDERLLTISFAPLPEKAAEPHRSSMPANHSPRHWRHYKVGSW